MSFKREGDDHSLLKNLQKRRVGDLLSANIPNDEALLLKNGRYACTICRHRPIFDTMSVLATHRKSNRHLESLTSHLQRQKDYKDLIERRKQEQYVKTGSGKLFIGKQTSNGPLTCQPMYSSCAKKRIHRGSKFDRKQVLQVVTEKKKHEKAKASETVTSQSTDSLVRTYLKDIQRKKNFSDEVEKVRRNFGQSSTSQNETNKRTLEMPESVAPAKVSCKESESISAPTTRVVSDEDKEKADYYLSLRMRGWKKDSSGTWIKDEDAEFDSDEEEPAEFT